MYRIAGRWFCVAGCESKGRNLSEVVIEALARRRGGSGEWLPRRDLRDHTGTWRKDRAFDLALVAQDAIDPETVAVGTPLKSCTLLRDRLEISRDGTLCGDVLPFADDFAGEAVDVGFRRLPGIAEKARFVAGFAQELLAIQVILHGHLR